MRLALRATYLAHAKPRTAELLLEYTRMMQEHQLTWNQVVEPEVVGFPAHKKETRAIKRRMRKAG